MSYLPGMDRIEGALAILRENEPPEGYYLAFSGGKDSCVIKELARMAGVKFHAVYANTTIDPPELTGFMRRHHPDVEWTRPEKPLLAAVAARRSGPPTRGRRWCCEQYKETYSTGGVILGVRAAESERRRGAWNPVLRWSQDTTCVLPIFDWSDEETWAFIRARKIPYCCLYDQGFTRLGCVGCPISKKRRAVEFQRWPAFERGWRRAVCANWERWHNVPSSVGPGLQSRFKTPDDMWRWWMEDETPDLLRGDCLTGLLWTNEVGATADEMDAIDAGAKEGA